jgi:Protein of unknown function (DUF2892)
MANIIKVNESGLDRIIRVVAGAALEILAWGGIVLGVLGVILGILGVILIVTGLVGFCPLYTLFSFRTNKS